MIYDESKNTVTIERYSEVIEVFFKPEIWDYEAGDPELVGGMAIGLKPYSRNWKRVEISFSRDSLEKMWSLLELAINDIKSHLTLGKDGILIQEIEGRPERCSSSDVYYRVLSKIFGKYKTYEGVIQNFLITHQYNEGDPFYELVNKKDGTSFKFYMRLDLNIYLNLLSRLFKRSEKTIEEASLLDQEKAFTI